ncbi:Protein archease [uncultured archaeon]|nr:Protein archease [uncultured archaeon]
MENKHSQKFKFLEHTADVKFQAFGKSIEEVFENSSLALKETICGKLEVEGEKEKTIKIRGDDLESLLYTFLEEIIYLLDAEDFILKEIKSIEINDLKLKAILVGDNASNYGLNSKVKAVTYNEMFIKEENGKWISQVVLDV